MVYSDQQEEFDFTGGHPVLDFVNTLDARMAPVPNEILRRYEDLLAWSVEVGTVSERGAEALDELAKRDPSAAQTALESAREVREALFGILRAIENGMPPPAADLVRFNAGLAESMSHARILATDDGFELRWEGPELERPIWSIVQAASDMLLAGDVSKIGVCASETCQYLFFDTTRNHSRRWCDAAICGNRARVRRYREKHKASLAEQPD